MALRATTRNGVCFFLETIQEIINNCENQFALHTKNDKRSGHVFKIDTRNHQQFLKPIGFAAKASNGIDVSKSIQEIINNCQNQLVLYAKATNGVGMFAKNWTRPARTRQASQARPARTARPCQARPGMLPLR